ncbi:Asparagine--tRNA ligase, cytoplasmic [Microtus ochrogaster]|uniref:Asparagine--tRNA ligase, cytoplasmic n=1 Tax=Microtus ochrogaster TaxID=79684 RepID=A0A8J6GH31_MICOH|nr:Asparagine--tRNA ligase, cytoplasmic [Microtus ochrogaster]
MLETKALTGPLDATWLRLATDTHICSLDPPGQACLKRLQAHLALWNNHRAEQSRTRRNLAEFTHVETECPFLTFQHLLNRLEDLVCNVVDRVLKSPVASIVYDLNLSFKPLKRPFRRMNSSDAIEWLREHSAKKEDTILYEFGDDIPEAPEILMTDTINESILLCRFPVENKFFYTQQYP